MDSLIKYGNEVERKLSGGIDEKNHMGFVLYDAVMKDNIDVIKKTEFKDQLTPTKNTVLHLACQHGSMKCMEHVLSVDESLLLKINSRGETGLHLAARQGHYDAVVALFDVAAKSLPPKSKCFKNTSLTVKQILIRTLNKEGDTALHVSVRYNHNNLVQLLVTEDPSHSYPRNKNGETPLYLASFWCYSDIIRIILDNSESPTFGGPYGSTALHAAVMNDGGHECVKLLLERNKDLIKVANRFGRTAFHYVAYSDLYTIVEDLVGADKSVGYLQDNHLKRTALHVAANEGNVNVMRKFVEYYPDSWDIVDRRGQNILHIAVQHDRKEVIKFILSHDCKAITDLLIQRDKEGDTPLHLIAKLGCYVEELMNLRTVDWKVLNLKGLTPLDVLNTELDTGNLADQAKIRTILTNAEVKRRDFNWHKITPREIQDKKDPQSLAKEIKQVISTHIIVAALIATLAFTAGFAMPGGFNSTEGENQGSPMLLKKKAFQVFILTDALALLLSMSSLVLYFTTVIIVDVKMTITLFVISHALSLVSIYSMMLAFMSGTYAVLSNLPALAIAICVISSPFILLYCYVVYRIKDVFYSGVDI